MQSAHAVAQFAKDHPEKFSEWNDDTGSIICLQVPDESTLIQLYDKWKSKTQTSKFYEPDIESYTSVSLFATPDIRKKFSHLPLSLKKRKEVNND